MKLSIKYFLLLCIMCLSTIDVCAQNVGKGIIKAPKVPKIKPPRVKPTVNWTAIVAHEVRKANEASSKASTTTSKNTKLPDVRLTIPRTKNSKKKQQEILSSLLSSQGLYRLDSLLKESYVSRFVNYARINSQSTEGEDVAAFPLSMGQRQMARLVEQDLLKLAKNNKSLQVVRSESEYVYAKLPATTKRKLPSIMLMAHLDITPEAPGGNIKPIVHRNYRGGDIVLPSGVVLSPESPQGKLLKECIGKTIITSDGNTLLGADDKTGCTVLVSLICNLLYGKPFEHGDLYFVFSQNEDIGRAADGFETKYVGGNPDVVIDVDGDDPHAFSVENFTAAMRIYIFHGKSAHPGEGYANKYGDALTAASYFVGQIPPYKHPSVSRGKQGYIHCYDISHPKDSAGKVISDDYLVKVRLRYFDKLEGDTLRQMLDSAEGKTIDAFPFVKVEASAENLQYENVAYTMYPTLPDIIKKAYASLGKKVSPRSERGGTTSAMIAAKGLRGGACLFSGQQAEHSIYEWTCVEDMMDMTNILQKIIMLINK
ncbi:MAG: hypothetical protein UH541_05610 [Prevotella sp.]|nr:hypothetical protein [Prevotella sp.]